VRGDLFQRFLLISGPSRSTDPIYEQEPHVVPDTDAIRGFVFDVATGQLNEVG
jgi:hypothetical protein